MRSASARRWRPTLARPSRIPPAERARAPERYLGFWGPLNHCRVASALMRQSASASKDRRAAERIATSLRGKVFPGAIDCVITDFTKFGARLRFGGPPPDGDRLIMVVWSSGVAFESAVRWRRKGEIGLAFVSSRDLRRPAPPHLAEAQAL